MPEWDDEVDFIVIGAGSGGMAGAITAHDQGLNTLVLEKSEYYGGTSALSGGVVWIPNNPFMPAAGIDDSDEDGFQYLNQVTRGEVNEQRLRAYVRTGREMVKYFHEHTRVEFEAAETYCDYYPELEGGKLGARSLATKPFSRRKLGREIYHQRPPLWRGVLNRFSLTAREARFVTDFDSKAMLFIVYRLLLHYADIPSRLRGLPDNRATLGQALVASLRRSLMDRKVPLYLQTHVAALLTDGQKICGVEFVKDGNRQRVRATRGVLMASGGFASNPSMRAQYQPAPASCDWTAASPDDTGDGIRLGQSASAAVDFMHCAWWTPVIREPGGKNWALIVGKAMPGSIFVNGAGLRFTNEAAPYEDVVKGQFQSYRETGSTSCYMIFDATYRHKYTVGRLPPTRVQSDEKMAAEYRDSEYLTRADTLVALADKLGIDGPALEQTVETFNADAKLGTDSQFQRGDSASDRYYSDPSNHPNPSLAPIEQAPFYAVAIYPGDLGTKGGLKCDELARVLDSSGQVIQGLYATGNCSAAVMGDSYPGAGSTIGPAMTFAYIAARHAAGRPGNDNRGTKEHQETPP